MYVENSSTIYSIRKTIMRSTARRPQLTVNSDIYQIPVYYVTQLCTCTRHGEAGSGRRKSYIMYDAPEAFPKVSGPPDYGRTTDTFLMRFPYYYCRRRKNKILTGGQFQNNLLCHSRISCSFIKCCCCLDYKASRMPHGSSIIVLHNNISYYILI